MSFKHTVIGYLAVLALSACAPVREAQQTVAQADSLLAADRVYSDSLSLLRAVDALAPWQLLLPDDYAKACFYYGRILRINERYTESVPYLLRARHSHTGDHILLGRTYSNLALICRLEGNHPLSYTLYEQSAEQFSRGGDNRRYGIAQTNMAYALAEQADTAGVRALLTPLQHNNELADMCNETYAEAFMRAGDYQQGLYFANLADREQPSVVMIKAQCFSLTGQLDSATIYAGQVLQHTSHPFLRANALYILTQQDSTAGITEVRSAAEERAIVLHHIADEQGDLARAVEIILQDGNRQPRNWNLLIVVLLCIIALLIAWWRHMRHIVAARKQQNDLLRKQIDERRQMIRREVSTNIEALLHADDWRKSIGWNDYEQFCLIVNKQFFMLADKLKTRSLNEKEIRLCMLVLMDCFDSKQTAKLLNYAESGVRNFKQHTANKLECSSRELKQQLLRIITGEL